MRNLLRTTNTTNQPITQKLNSFIQSYLQPQKKNYNNSLDSIDAYQQLKQERLTSRRKTHPKHHHISSLIQQLKHTQPEHAITLYHDLETIWNYHPTDQDNLAYITATTTHTKPSHYSEAELAQRLRLAIKYHLKDQQELLLREKPIQEYHDQQLIHGALLLINPDSQQFILNQLNNNKIQQHWIELDLIQALAQQHQTDLLFHTLANLSRRHPNRDRVINLIDRLLSHIVLPTNSHNLPPHILQIESLAERIHQTTGIEIFRDKPAERLAGKLFIRLRPSYDTFDHVWAWYQLSKSRTGGRVLESCLIAILQFRAELARKPSDLLDQILSDFRGLALLSRSLSPAELVGCMENILWLAIETKRAPLACAALDLELIQLLEGSPGVMEGTRMEALLGPLFSLAESREQAYMFYERLAQLGRPTPRFFERLLRGYLALCEAPPAALQERPQALPMPRLMAILQHMKLAGIPPDSQTYAVLLNHYSAVVRCNPRNLSTRLQLERIHTLIKLDINLEPDPQLIHQLFKAFSYNGLYDKAWAIWDQFFSPRPDAFSTNNKKKLTSMEHLRKVSNPSFATMFDLAGFESERHGDGRLNMKAIQGWNFLLDQSLLRRRSSSPSQPPVTTAAADDDTRGGTMSMSCSSLNKNLFDAWIECLCRSGRIHEASKLVFPPRHGRKEGEDYAEDDDDGEEVSSSLRSDEEVYMVTQPFVDQRTLSLLLRFAKRHDASCRPPASESDTGPAPLRPTIVAAILSHFPHLWPSVSDQGPFN